MAEWKKVIVSGSIAELNIVSASTFSGSYEGDGSGLTGITATSLDIDNFGTDLTSTTLATSDLILVSDAGDDGRANIGDLATPLAGTNLEESLGTIRIAASAAGAGLAGGAGSALSVNVDDTGIEINSDSLRLKDEGVTNAKMAHMAQSTLKGRASGAGTGDATDLSATQVRTILNVEDGADVTDAAAVLGAIPVIVSESAQISGSIFGGVSGDITITAAGVASIGANSVALGTDTTGNYVATLANASNGGTTISNGSGEGGAATVALNLNDLSAGAVNVAADSIAIIDADDSNGTKKESIVDLVAGIAGTGIGNASGQLSVTYGTGASTAAQGNTAVTFNGTANEIELTTNNFTSVGGGGTVTIGLPDDVTIGGDMTVVGDLTVQGSQTNLNVTDLAIEDRVILLNSGSNVVGNTGIVFGGSEAAVNSGSALIWDGTYNSNDGRLRIANGVGASQASSISPVYSIAGVYEGNATDAANDQADHPGNIRIDSSEIYIYV